MFGIPFRDCNLFFFPVTLFKPLSGSWMSQCVSLTLGFFVRIIMARAGVAELADAHG